MSTPEPETEPEVEPEAETGLVCNGTITAHNDMYKLMTHMVTDTEVYFDIVVPFLADESEWVAVGFSKTANMVNIFVKLHDCNKK